VSLAGPLDHPQLDALLQTLAVNRSTGKLNLTHGSGHTVLVFREGRITYSAASSARETFGSVLLLRGLITEADLAEALARQSSAAEAPRLGRVLVEMGKVDERALREVMQEQTREVLQELQAWRTGSFTFEPLDISGEGEVDAHVKGFVVPERFTAEEGIARPRPPAKAAPNLDMPPADCLTPPRGTTRISLATIASKAPSPPFKAEITLGLMRGAARVLNRGVLFLVRLEEVRGMSQFGLDLPGRFAAEAVRDTAIPLSEPSVFRHVVEHRESYRGLLPPTPWNRHLVERLGGLRPPEVAVVPMVVAGTVRVVFYGDNLPDNRGVGPLDGLEETVAGAALAMERALLESRDRSPLDGGGPPPGQPS
jgi:hypothetical protein